MLAGARRARRRRRRARRRRAGSRRLCRRRCSARSRTPGLDGRCPLVGHVEDMAAAYRAAHVTVVASIEPEAFGRAAIEAAGHGLPRHRDRHRCPAGDGAGRSPRRRTAARSPAGWCRPATPEPCRPAGRGPDACPRRTRAAIGRTRARRHAVAGHFTLEAMQRRTLAVLRPAALGTRSCERGVQQTLPRATAKSIPNAPPRQS